jgi:hypothetical protein
MNADNERGARASLSLIQPIIIQMLYDKHEVPPQTVGLGRHKPPRDLGMGGLP